MPAANVQATLPKPPATSIVEPANRLGTPSLHDEQIQSASAGVKQFYLMGPERDREVISVFGSLDSKNVIKPGDNGAQMKNLQEILHRAGFLDAQPNGHYGRATQEAVVALQDIVDPRGALDHPGRIGARELGDFLRTRDLAAIDKAKSSGQWNALDVLKIGDTGPEVKNVQIAINTALGRNAVSTDGILGKDTVAAYAKVVLEIENPLRSALGMRALHLPMGRNVDEIAPLIGLQGQWSLAKYNPAIVAQPTIAQTEAAMLIRPLMAGESTLSAGASGPVAAAVNQIALPGKSGTIEVGKKSSITGETMEAAKKCLGAERAHAAETEFPDEAQAIGPATMLALLRAQTAETKAAAHR